MDKPQILYGQNRNRKVVSIHGRRGICWTVLC